MTSVLLSPGKDRQVMIERAAHAVRAAQRLLPLWRDFARVIARRPNLKVILDPLGPPRTDGQTIWLPIPMELADLTEHDRRVCGKRDENFELACPACRCEEVANTFIYHELAHILFDTFQPASDEERGLVLQRGIEVECSGNADSGRAKAIRKLVESIPENLNYMSISKAISPFLPTLINALEDTRVNAAMMRERPGTVKMFRSLMHRIMVEGMERDDGSMSDWSDCEINLQAMIGLHCESSQYDSRGDLDPRVATMLDDPRVASLCHSIRVSSNPLDIYRLAFPALEILRDHGFCLAPDDASEPEEPEQENEDDNDESGSDEEEDGSPDDAEDSDETSSKDNGEQGATGDGVEGGSSNDDPGSADSQNDGDGEGSPDVGPGRDGLPDHEEDDPPGDSSHQAQEPDACSSSDNGDLNDESSDDDGGDDEEDVAQAGDDPGDGKADGSDDGSEGDNGDDTGGESDGDDQGDNPGEAGDSPLDGEAAEGDGEGPGDSVEGEGGDQGDDQGSGSPGDSGAPSGGSGESPGSDRADKGDASEAGKPNVPGDGDSDDSGLGTPDQGDAEISSERPGETSDDPSPQAGPDGPQNGQKPATTPQESPPGGISESPVRRTNQFMHGSGADEGQPESGLDDTNEAPTDSRNEPYSYEEMLQDGTADAVEEGFKQFGQHADEEPGTAQGREEQLLKELIETVLQQIAWFDQLSWNIDGVDVVRPGEGRGAWSRMVHHAPLIRVPESILQPALGRLRVAFTENRRSEVARHLKGGKVDTRVLGKRGGIGDPRVFKRTSIPGKRDYAVLLGGDCSGSTSSGIRLQLIKETVHAQADLLSRLGIRFSVAFHTGDHMEDRNVVSLMLCKDFQEPWDNKAKQAVADIHPSDANLDGHTLETYRKMIAREKASDKLIIYYTDGAMPAANFDEELEILQREIVICRQMGVKLVGVGVDTDSPKQHGLDTICISGLSDVNYMVDELAKRLL